MNSKVQKVWTVAEERRLVQQFREGVLLRFIAMNTGRTYQAVKRRIVDLRASGRHGVIPLRYGKRG